MKCTRPQRKIALTVAEASSVTRRSASALFISLRRSFKPAGTVLLACSAGPRQLARAQSAAIGDDRQHAVQCALIVQRQSQNLWRVDDAVQARTQCDYRCRRGRRAWQRPVAQRACLETRRAGSGDLLHRRAADCADGIALNLTPEISESACHHAQK